ncbi:MAG TPA: TIM-barrel domain-containing protein [Gaiellaceae bacterium]|nr:TIM-barrel domain-containing protein [Gaiellaceae bacterium]
MRARLVIALFVVVAVAGCGHGNVGGGKVTWKVQSSPFALEIQRGGKTLVSDATGAAGPGSRLSYTLADGSQHTVTSLVSSKPVAGGTEYSVKTDEANRKATLTVTRTPRAVRVAWRLVPDTNVDTVYWATKSTAKTEHFTGTGVNHTGLDLSGQLVQLKVAYSCQRSIVTPFWVSSAGYGVYYDTDAVGNMEFKGTHDGMACNDANSEHPLCPAVSAADRVQACFKTSRLDTYYFVGAPAQVVADFRITAGRAPVPPPQQFATIKWRDKVKGSAEVLDDVTQMRKLGIPLGSVLVDNPWETDGCWGTLTFDKRFGDPSALIEKVHAAGVGFMVWVSPWVTSTPACKALSQFPAGTTFPTPQGWDGVDFTSTEGRTTYERKINSLVQLGVDGFKGDRGDETDLEGIDFANGNAREVHNVYPQLFASAVVQGSRTTPVTMFRSGWTHTPTVGASVWAGDQIPDFGGLQDAIRSLASLGASGFSIAGSDVGGYATQNGKTILTPEAFERWSQLGAVSPIFEVGGADRAQTFWKLGTQATAVARDSVLLHYSLFPYFYALAHTSAPIVQPLALQFPDDEQAWKSDLELMIGPSLLAAPVTSISVTPSVYLPKGKWLDLFAGTTVSGGKTIQRNTPMTQFPLYLRDGATIPFNLRRGWALDALQRPGYAGWLTGGSTVELSGAPHHSEVLFVRKDRPSKATVDGKAASWTWVTKPFPGALVEVAPQNGHATVSVG